MNSEKYVKDIFESNIDYRKVVLIKFLSKNDKDFMKEVGFTENDINPLNSEFKNILIEQCEEY